MQPLTCRIAEPADAASLSQLVNSAYRGASSKRGWTSEADLLGGQRTDADLLRDVILSKEDVILSFAQDGVATACVHLQRRGALAYLGMLTVKPETQGRGTGKHVLAEAEAWAASHWGTRRIELTVIRRRSELIAWYERRGYHDTGRREAFPVGEPRFGIPKVDDLEFAVLEKDL